jgi:FAD:protein FMN transferase
MSAGRQSFVEQIMGLPVSIHLRGYASAVARQATVDRVFAELRHMELIFSTYRADSEISRLRRGELSVAACDAVVHEVLDLCADASRRTDGYFDALLGGGLDRLDPSGLVKGWAVERAAQHLASLGDDYYINAGGDIALGLAGPDSAPWRIGIEDPTRPDGLIGVVSLRYGAVATSGLARRGTHIVNPLTGTPATAFASVTVTGPSLLWADVYATAATAAGRLDAFAWPAGYEAMAIVGSDAAATTRSTAGWRFAQPTDRQPGGTV